MTAVAGTEVDRLVEQHLPLVGYAVAEAITKLPTHVNRDDLMSAATMALVHSARSFDPARGVPFPSYAKIRLRGAIIDELRGHDWISRGVRVKARRRAEAEDSLAAALGRHPTAGELASHLGTTVEQLNSTDGDVHRSVVLSLQGFAEAGTLEGMLPSPEPGPQEVLLVRERLSYLVAAVAALPVRLRFVVQGYFLDERPMADLAVELRVTESRVSQMRAEALAMLRDGMDAMLSSESVVDAPGAGCVARRKAAYIEAVASGSDFRGRLSA